MKSSEPNLRIPAVLMPSYLRATSTEEGKKAEMRVRVDCGICKEIRYYSIYRGVTKMAGSILVCEACRHSYQKFKRRPCILKCAKGGGCYILGDNSKSRCKACWIAHILRLCPLPCEVYTHLVKHLPEAIREKMSEDPPVLDDIPEDQRGKLGLEMQNDEDEWEDITELATPQEDEEEEEEEEEEPVKREVQEEVEVNGEQLEEEDLDDETLDAYFEAEHNLRSAQVINTTPQATYTITPQATTYATIPQVLTSEELDGRVSFPQEVVWLKGLNMEPVKWTAAGSEGITYSISIPSLASLPSNTITLPSNTISIPNNAITIPNNALTLSNNTITIPNNALNIPSNTITIPSNTITIPNNTITLPSNNAITISNNTLTIPSNNTITIPSNNTITLPSNNTITIPNNTNTIPNNIITIPNNAITIPNNGITIPNNITIPNSGITIPNNSITIPNNGLTISNNSITIPSINTTIPNNSTTIPSNTITIPSNTLTIPSNTLTIPSNTLTIPSNTLTIPSNSISIPSNSLNLPSNTLSLPSNTLNIPSVPNSQTYFNMSNMSSSDGLTALTPLQPMDPNLSALTPMTPMELPDHAHLNGTSTHTSEDAMYTIKQECPAEDDGESQEARLFQNISIKQELRPPSPSQDPTATHPLLAAASPYFSPADIRIDPDNQIRIEVLDAPADIVEDAWDAASLDDCKEAVVRPKSKTKKKKRIKDEENGLSNILEEAAKRAAIDEALDDPCPKKRKMDRFDGMPEEEVVKKFLPDHLGPNMDILIIGINPGLFAAHKGHHYAGPGNHFWKCMYLSGLIPEPFTAFDDYRLLDYGIGFTNIVARTTRGSADLTREEIKQGGVLLLEKLRKYRPLIAVFNGKGIYEIFSGKKQFHFGKQPEKVEGTDTNIFVLPSSSARCAQLPRALDKVPFYSALRKYRDFLKGIEPHIDEDEITFTNVKLTNPRPPGKQESKVEYDDFGEPKKSFKSDSSKGLKALKRNLRLEEQRSEIKTEIKTEYPS